MNAVSTLLICFLATSKAGASTFDTNRFNALVAKLKEDAFELAQEVENRYAFRCDADTMNSCQSANFRECQASNYPNQECLDGPNYLIDACTSESSLCSGLWDRSISTVRIPENDFDAVDPNGNPTDPKLIESVCFIRTLDDWFVRKRETDKSFWDSLGVEPRSMYFGSHNGAFRIFPGRQSQQCGVYDPRLRPWYVAGSSGPKNVVLVLDLSGSMQGSRLANLKTAASRVVSTLTISDRVLIVPFASDAYPMSDNGFVFVATDDNKRLLLDRIEKLQAGGGTNFFRGFEEAFNILDKSIANEYSINCNTAILFLTDGENTEGPDVSDVTDLVDLRISQISQKLNKEVLLFTYSVSEEGSVHAFPSELACSVERGVWSKIVRSTDIIDSLSSYYRLFALGLGSEANSDFAAWVEPYTFATGNALGTTVSVPVYDRTKSPHLFLGVVGVDVAIDAIEAALTVSSDSSTDYAREVQEEALKRVVETSDASCPKELELTPCELEAFRKLGAPNDEALCEANCTDSQIAQVEEEACRTISDYPSNIFVEGISNIASYEERVCCLVGETEPSTQCQKEDDEPKIGLIIGVVAACVGGIVMGLLLYFCWWTKREPSTPKKEAVGSKNEEKSYTISSYNMTPVPPVNPDFKISHSNASAPEAQ